MILARSADGFLRDPALAFAAGGAVGGLILSTATFLLYAKKGQRLFWRIAACSVGGGLAGFIGYTMHPIVLFANDSEANTFELFLLWQSAIGLLFGFLWPIGEKASVGDPEAIANT